MFGPPGIGYKPIGATKKVQSHQITSTRKLQKNRPTLGRNYHRNYIEFGFGGWGMAYYFPEEDSSFRTISLSAHYPIRKDNTSPFSTTTRSLSQEWRSFGLHDGSVLFTHPSRKQVLQWNQKTMEKENASVGHGTMDQHTKTKIQRLLADNSLEYVPLSVWRRNQLWRLIHTHGSRAPEQDQRFGSLSTPAN
jgi:hypothetical protein